MRQWIEPEGCGDHAEVNAGHQPALDKACRLPADATNLSPAGRDMNAPRDLGELPRGARRQRRRVIRRPDVTHAIVQPAPGTPQRLGPRGDSIQADGLQQDVGGPVVAHGGNKQTRVHERKRVVRKVLPQPRIRDGDLRIAADPGVRIEPTVAEAFGDLAEEEDLADARRGLHRVRCFLVDHLSF